MKTGRPKKPTILKQLHGTYRPSRANPAEPKPKVPQTLAPPAWLDNYALELWSLHAEPLRSAGLLTEIDIPLFVAACERWGVYRRAIEALKDSLVSKSAVHGEIRKPQDSIAKDALMLCKSILEQFGCTPGSRAKVTAAKVDDDEKKKTRHLHFA